MNIFLVLAFLFFAGSILGWLLELFYRRFFSKNNPDRKWINPGFLIGPYLPLYGFSLCLLCLLSFIQIPGIENPIIQKIVLFVIMALCITFVEFIAGLIFIHGMKIWLWDYSKCWGNIMGIICPQYTFFWWLLSAIYYFAIHPHVLNSLYWLSSHLTFSFVIGFFYGVFMIDLVYSLKLLTKIRQFAKEKNIHIRLQEFKVEIRKKNAEFKEKTHFLFAFKSDNKSLKELLHNYHDHLKNK